jgi:hypothetical protein
MAEGSEFELPVPVSKPSNDGIKLEFAAARRIALVEQRRIGRLHYCDAARRQTASGSARDDPRAGFRTARTLSLGIESSAPTAGGGVGSAHNVCRPYLLSTVEI